MISNFSQSNAFRQRHEKVTPIQFTWLRDWTVNNPIDINNKHVLVAGGSVLRTLLGVQETVTDIDVFVMRDEDTFTAMTKEVLRAGWTSYAERKLLGLDQAAKSSGDELVEGVRSRRLKVLPPLAIRKLMPALDIIEMPELTAPLEVFQTFDLNMSECGIYQGQLVVSPNFLGGLLKRELVVTKTHITTTPERIAKYKLLLEENTRVEWTVRDTRLITNTVVF